MKKFMGKLIQLFTGSTEAYPKQYYPVGWILESAVNVNPSTFCIGKWELYGKGRVAACIDTGDSDFATAGKELGEKTHKLIADEMPKHNHRLSVRGGSIEDGGNMPFAVGHVLGQISENTFNAYSTSLVETTGSDKAHNNIQPTVVVYRWKRIS